MKDPYQARLEAVQDEYLLAIRKEYVYVVTALAKKLPLYKLDSQGEFHFSNNPALKKQVDKLFGKLYQNVYTLSVSGITTAWDLAVERNNEIAQQIYGKDLAELPNKYKTRYLANNADAKWAFVERKDGGLLLSDKVWQNTLQARANIELGIEWALGKGTSAAATARDLVQYLEEPDKLFRRVRDEKGALRLSKAAEVYHPGAGKYRSSYKNAHRLAACEINSSYELSKQKKRNQQDFVVGVAVRTSPRHKPSDDGGGIQCSELAGDYPKDFDFSNKWHPRCRCFTFDIIKTDKELEEDLVRILDGKEPLPISANMVEELPTHFNKYIKDNEEKWANWKNPPRFLSNVTKK